ncbi:uncharacterized protein N7496_011770 [Penicillium cataractarum]|uniref:Uncharacterized protein n=1 Tax=Penicillium cataractarum TaxID=2100454 RepID=A0A9W9RG19_9EURO|nr:uncharacterized protein N7496_011770 [Penicillium cataractarum]KAJ5359357.1 hypothetical protein N7496_011770 [Penicillium cataractarum]
MVFRRNGRRRWSTGRSRLSEIKAGPNDLRVRRVLSEVTSEQYAQKIRQEMQAERNGGGGGMGSLADELEKVKVQLPRSKTASSSRALSHPYGDRLPSLGAQEEPPEEMEAFRWKA